ncbi:MAG: hypothetical protein M1833_006289 [Piccolia ochrophora]|nr:MAG: hypothetical protein M1833_006289 [Piccolia ochrophora]
MTTRAPIVIPAATKHTATDGKSSSLEYSDPHSAIPMDASNSPQTLLSSPTPAPPKNTILKTKRRTALSQSAHSRSSLRHISFIFPTAPTIPITANNSFRMPGWYDIASFTSLAHKTHDVPGILSSRETLHALVAREVAEKKIPQHRIVVGGFSQGGAMALIGGLSTPSATAPTGDAATSTLGGVFALSGYLLLPERFAAIIDGEDAEAGAKKGDVARATPIWMGHGVDDPLVRCEWGRETAGRLRAWGWGVDWNEYRYEDSDPASRQHSADAQELADLEQWLEKRLPAVEGSGGGGA